SMWVPVSTQNRLPVDAAVSGTVDVSDRADRQLGQVALSGSTVELYNEEVEIPALADVRFNLNLQGASSVVVGIRSINGVAGEEVAVGIAGYDGELIGGPNPAQTGTFGPPIPGVGILNAMFVMVSPWSWGRFYIRNQH